MKTIHIKINAKVPEGVDPRFVAFQIFLQMSHRASRLESWQQISAPIGDQKIGECHFEVVDDNGD